jgi:hypothetical protein
MYSKFTALTDTRATIHRDVPALNTLWVLAADNSLSAVEVRAAAESCQANIEFKTQIIEHYVCDLGAENPTRRSRY